MQKNQKKRRWRNRMQLLISMLGVRSLSMWIQSQTVCAEEHNSSVMPWTCNLAMQSSKQAKEIRKMIQPQVLWLLLKHKTFTSIHFISKSNKTTCFKKNNFLNVLSLMQKKIIKTSNSLQMGLGIPSIPRTLVRACWLLWVILTLQA